MHERDFCGQTHIRKIKKAMNIKYIYKAKYINFLFLGGLWGDGERKLIKMDFYFL